MSTDATTRELRMDLLAAINALPTTPVPSVRKARAKKKPVVTTEEIIPLDEGANDKVGRAARQKLGPALRAAGIPASGEPWEFAKAELLRTNGDLAATVQATAKRFA